MQTRRLGNSDMHITPIGFGAWAIGGGDWAFGWGSQDDADSVATIREAIDLGINWVDTAAVYGLGHSEEVVAKALEGLPSRPFVFTKCERVWDENRKIGKSLKAVAAAGWQADMPEVLPAVTCTAQATILTGQTPDQHGVVANGWLFRDVNEVRFWQQSNRLIEAEPLYVTARDRAKARSVPFKSAKLFWWFNQGAAVDISVTPKPWYAVDGNKAFGIAGTPAALPIDLERRLGRFPFQAFWGPMAGKPSTDWIAVAAA